MCDALTTIPKVQEKKQGELEVNGRIETIKTIALLSSAGKFVKVIEN